MCVCLFVIRKASYVCVCVYLFVCLFVSHKKGSVTFDPNNAKFPQKIRLHGMGNKLYSTKNDAELAEKFLKMCLVVMKNCILFTGD